MQQRVLVKWCSHQQIMWLMFAVASEPNMAAAVQQQQHAACHLHPPRSCDARVRDVAIAANLVAGIHNNDSLEALAGQYASTVSKGCACTDERSPMCECVRTKSMVQATNCRPNPPRTFSDTRPTCTAKPHVGTEDLMRFESVQ